MKPGKRFGLSAEQKIDVWRRWKAGQTIKTLAGHFSRQMLERYSHIRSEAKLAAIQSMDEEAIAPVLDERRYKIRYIEREDKEEAEANSMKTKSGPGRIRTYDQRIMSPLL